MKRKENLSLKRKNLVVLLVTLVLVISSLLTACGSSAAETTPATKEEVVDDKVEEKTAEEVAQTETVVEEPETVIVVEPETYETALDWAIAVNATIPELTIWNSLTKQGIVLENSQKYLVKEGDILVLCGNFEGSIDTQIDVLMLNEVLSTSIHQEYEFIDIPAGETDINILLRVNEEEYELGLIIVSENAIAIASEGSEITDMSGKDWASSLNYEEPKLIAWNDETGTREIIENSGKYVMQQGDVLAIYYPTGYFVFNASPVDFSGGLTMMGNFVRMEYILPSESKEINLEVVILNPQDELENFNYVITTP